MTELNRKEKIILKIKKIFRRRLIECMMCGRKSRLSNWVFNGNEKEFSEGYLKCPLCKRWNSITEHPQKLMLINIMSSLKPEELFTRE